MYIFRDKYGIYYEIESGTLLGAVKLGNFIPWDIDLDIGKTGSNILLHLPICLCFVELFINVKTAEPIGLKCIRVYRI